jgi:hypothetical protein
MLNFAISEPKPLRASSTSSGTIVVRSRRKSVTGIIGATLIDEFGDEHEVKLGKPTKNSLVIEIVTDVRGLHVLRVRCKSARDDFAYGFDVMPGPATRLLLEALPAGVTGSSLVVAGLCDKFYNPVPAAGKIKLNAQGGTLSKPVQLPRGQLRALVTTEGPASVKVLARASGKLEASAEVLMPEVDLACPDYLVLDDNRPPLFPVDVRLRLDKGEKLRSFDVSVTLNELTGFHHFDESPRTRRFGPIETHAAGKTVRLNGSAREPVDLRGGPIQVARFWCECRGVGESALSVGAADFVISHSPDEPKAGNPALWRRKGCENKRRVKRLCINPIVLGTSWSAAEILQELQILQDNLDSACCTVTIEIYGRAIDNLKDKDIAAQLAAHTINGVRTYTGDGGKETPNSPKGEADDPGKVEAGHRLTKVAQDIILNNRRLRDPDCLNIYFAASTGAGKIIKKQRDPDTGVISFVEVPFNGFGSVTITGQLVSPDGQGTSNTNMKDANGNVLTNTSVPSIQDVSGIFISKRQGKGQFHVKHEVGHALGLRHRSEYTAGTPLANGPSVMDEYDETNHNFTKAECEAIMRNINGLLKNF